MWNVELFLRSRLVKEALSSGLMQAGFSVFHERDQRDNNTIVVLDFEDYKDPESARTHQSQGVKLVALASESNSRKLELNDIAALSGVLTYDYPSPPSCGLSGSSA
jgi:hypothetical protein